MNSRYWIAGLVAGSTLIAGTLLWTGCEISRSDSADEDVLITPESAVVTPGKTVTFKASNGYTYTWSLDPNDGSGRLNTYHGDTVIYTCLSTNIGTMPKKIVVTSTIEGSSAGGSSSNTAYSQTAYAEIFWPNGTGGGGNPSISPSSANVSTNGTQVFTVSGGSSPYTWSVTTSSLGSVSPTTGNSTTYTASGSGINTITVTDDDGHTDTATINQP